MGLSSTKDPLDGISGELKHNPDGLRAVLCTFIAVSWYNVLELVILIFCAFRRWNGLYFWSLLVSGCLGVFPYSLGFLLKFFTHTNSTLCVTLLTLGWWCMVTGQSMVLYSRLHLILRDERVLRRVLAMIWVNVLLLHVPTTVLTYGSNAQERSPRMVRGYKILEKIQMTGFTIQESIISTLYIVATLHLLRLGWNRNRRKIMHQLVVINVLMLIMDLVLLGLEYASRYSIQITLKGAIYSVKLKLEFAVLGKLVEVVHGGHHTDPVQVLEHLEHVEHVEHVPVQSSGRGFQRAQPGKPAGVPISSKTLSMAKTPTWEERKP